MDRVCCRYPAFFFAMLLLFTSLVLCTGRQNALADTTIPVMVGYFDIRNAGAVTPEGVARIPGSGDYALVDEGQAQLIIVDSRGNYKSNCDTSVFGSNDPTGITYISSGPQAGNFAVTDELDEEIYIVDASCVLQDQLDTTVYGLNNPQGIAFISSGPYEGDLAYVTPGTPDEVFIVSMDGTTLRLKFNTPTTATNPHGLAYIDSGRYSGNLAIMGLSSRDVFVVDVNGILQDKFDIGSISTAPYGITFNSSAGNIEVIDKTADEIFSFNADGRLFDSFSTVVFGSSSPKGITYVDSGPMADTWAIIDNENDTVFYAKSDGALQDSCAVPPNITDPSGIAFIPETGHLAVLDAGTDEIYMIDTACNFQHQYDVASFGIGSLAPSGITYISGIDNFAFTDSSRDSVFFVNLSRPGRTIRQFGTNAMAALNPYGLLLIPPSNNFAIADKSLNEVYVVNQKGSLEARFDTGLFSARPDGLAFDPVNSVFAVVDADDDEVSLLQLPGLLLPGESCMCDLNNDGDVDGADLIDFTSEFGQTDCW